jgi:hypothetical protein
MAEVSFSTQDTGACPYCSHQNDCHILLAMTELLEEEVDDRYDDDMEIVIYACPEFEAGSVELEDED